MIATLREGRWLLLLTNSERMALQDLILEFLADASSTSAFMDLSVAPARITTPGDLLRVLDGALWASEITTLSAEKSSASATLKTGDLQKGFELES